MKVSPPAQEEDMSDPKIADTKPVVLELAAGTYWYCTCGESTNQPFCDGKHKDTGIEPLPRRKPNS